MMMVRALNHVMKTIEMTILIDCIYGRGRQSIYDILMFVQTNELIIYIFILEVELTKN